MGIQDWLYENIVVAADDQLQQLKALWKQKRALLYQVFNLAMIVFSALMIWKTLIVVTRSESPVVVVLSGSMEPAFQRGDILFLNNQASPIDVGEIVVFQIEDRDIPIVHRVLKVHNLCVRWLLLLLLKRNARASLSLSLSLPPFRHAHQEILSLSLSLPPPTPTARREGGDVDYLTKGDNNLVDDRGLYKPGQQWLKRKDVLGRAIATVPYIGMVTIMMNDYPKLKYILIGVMGLFVLTNKE
tara:strand:- start:224 stop:952 length:729 start_codon:yes stop_codon:yes gene_type:complete